MLVALADMLSQQWEVGKFLQEAIARFQFVAKLANREGWSEDGGSEVNNTSMSSID